MSKEKNKEATPEVHLGVDTWTETASVAASTDGLVPAARILAGEEPLDSEEE